ncbi:hypothetical protein L1887_40402 [Cichorium endivia]|nr:hypothetical protein L1887_40402 [Cichorium endivia]
MLYFDFKFVLFQLFVCTMWCLERISLLLKVGLYLFSGHVIFGKGRVRCMLSCGQSVVCFRCLLIMIVIRRFRGHVGKFDTKVSKAQTYLQHK